MSSQEAIETSRWTEEEMEVAKQGLCDCCYLFDIALHRTMQRKIMFFFPLWVCISCRLSEHNFSCMLRKKREREWESKWLGHRAKEKGLLLFFWGEEIEVCDRGVWMCVHTTLQLHHHGYEQADMVSVLCCMCVVVSFSPPLSLPPSLPLSLSASLSLPPLSLPLSLSISLSPSLFLSLSSFPLSLSLSLSLSLFSTCVGRQGWRLCARVIKLFSLWTGISHVKKSSVLLDCSDFMPKWYLQYRLLLQGLVFS